MDKEGNNKLHWENIYDTKTEKEFSWYQEYPKISLGLIRDLQLPKTANIIDIGGGDSHLVDSLLDQGYLNIWVLDISAKAIQRAKVRLGQKADQVQWIVNDVTTFVPPVRFDCWHDRATFHFLVSKEQISKYLAVARQSTAKSSYAIIGLFSQNGPEKCSGLDVKRYDEEALIEQLGNDFKKIRCTTEDHKTPFNSNQNFLYCSFKRN